MILDSFIDAGGDCLKLIPFLLITYLAMELLEHKAGDQLQKKIRTAGKIGPLWGGLMGVVPQCGFSAAASSLYAGRVITLGTLFAVYLSTSDEMLPIFLSEAVPVITIIKILTTKLFIAVVSGFIIEFVFVHVMKQQEKDMDIHTVCEHEHCSCNDGIIKSAIKHTLTITLYLFLISFVLNMVIAFVGEDRLSGIMNGIPMIGVLFTALIGLIPNCAASVAVTQMYLSGIISTGAMMAGLLVSAGVGLLVLFRLNRHPKENLTVVGLLYLTGIIWGLLFELSGIVF